MTTQPNPRPLGSDGADAGCDAVFEVLARYVEAQLRGGDVAAWAGVAIHFSNCDACREDAEGLAAACLELGLVRHR